jgi:hypothetical protein
MQPPFADEEPCEPCCRPAVFVHSSATRAPAFASHVSEAKGMLPPTPHAPSPAIVVIAFTDDEVEVLDPERRFERHLMRRRLQLPLDERRAIVSLSSRGTALLDGRVEPASRTRSSHTQCGPRVSCLDVFPAFPSL